MLAERNMSNIAVFSSILSREEGGPLLNNYYYKNYSCRATRQVRVTNAIHERTTLFYIIVFWMFRFSARICIKVYARWKSERLHNNLRQKMSFSCFFIRASYRIRACYFITHPIKKRPLRRVRIIFTWRIPRSEICGVMTRTWWEKCINSYFACYCCNVQ